MERIMKWYAVGLILGVAFFLGQAQVGWAQETGPRLKGVAHVTTMTLTSAAFKDGARIPVQYTADGEDVSPPIQWAKAPEGTREFALIVDDPDAPRTQPWVHWVVYHIPATVSQFPEGKPGKSLPDNPPGMQEGRNDFRKLGYGGPAPPRGHGPHRYFFRLYALDAPVGLNQPGASKEDVLKAMKGHVLEMAELMGTYER